jgi:hypothetical protein
MRMGFDVAIAFARLPSSAAGAEKSTNRSGSAESIEMSPVRRSARIWPAPCARRRRTARSARSPGSPKVTKITRGSGRNPCWPVPRGALPHGTNDGIEELRGMA